MYSEQIFQLIIGMDTTNSKLEDAGRVLAEAIRNYMYKTGIPDGLTALGYSSEDIPDLVRGTLPQVKMLIALTG